MKREIILTKDGSHTVSVPEQNVTYHSIHGALQESNHVFLKEGFEFFHQSLPKEEVLNIFEVGLGTGLNAMITAREAEKHARRVQYFAIEAYPLTAEEFNLLNYGKDPAEKELIQAIHLSEWDREIDLNPFFRFSKWKGKLEEAVINNQFHLVYFDAFAPSAQPELWTREIFEKLYASLLPGGGLVTYCSKGEVRRAMQLAGFSVTKLQGPPGKREMVRAFKE